MIGLTRQQKSCLDFLRSYSATHGVMPSFREIADHMGLKSLSRIHSIVRSLEERGAIRRIAARPRAIEIVGSESVQAVLLSQETFGLVQLYAGSQRTTVDTAANELHRQVLGANA